MSIRSILKSVLNSDTTPRPASLKLSFMDAQGTVIEPIQPNATGRVKLQGVSWLARCEDTQLCFLPVNTPVRVVDRVGLTLLIRPVAMPAVSTHDLSLLCRLEYIKRVYA
ncbi:MAG: NfeD family protein [Cyanobacteria bacterium P01_H01_bin.26]